MELAEPPVEAEVLAEEMSAVLNSLQRKDGQQDPLSGTRWTLSLNVGREPGTWMPPTWGVSGQRVKLSLAIAFDQDGRLQVLDKQSNPNLLTLRSARGGAWRVEGSFPSESVAFDVDHAGLTTGDTRCDVDLPPGKLFFSIRCLGRSLSGKPGGLSIEQMRMLIRRERRIVGLFTAQPLT